MKLEFIPQVRSSENIVLNGKVVGDISCYAGGFMAGIPLPGNNFIISHGETKEEAFYNALREARDITDAMLEQIIELESKIS